MKTAPLLAVKVVLFDSGQVGLVGFGVMEEEVDDADEADELCTEVASVVATDADD